MATPKFKEVSPYKSQYGTQINNLTDTVVNRQAFSYDPNTDPAYQSYAKEYGRLGDRARMNTLGDYAANTGGYASSYAVSAAQQAQNDYNQQLTNLIPGLMDAAYSRYKDDYNMNLSALSALTDLDNTAYGRWQDNRLYNRDKYESDRNYAFDVGRAKASDEQWAKEFGLETQKFKWQKSQGSSGRGGGSGRSGGGGRRGGYGGSGGSGGGKPTGSSKDTSTTVTLPDKFGAVAQLTGLTAGQLKAMGLSDKEIRRYLGTNKKK